MDHACIMHDADISKRYFLVFHLFLNFLHKQKKRSSDVTEQHLTAGRFRRYRGSNNDTK